MGAPTIAVNMKIDVSPKGIMFTIEGLESDLASLIGDAKTFEVSSVDYRSVDSSDILIRSTKMLQFVDRPDPMGDGEGIIEG